MPNLILRPSGLPEELNKPWSLQLRYHECLGETEYRTLARVSDEVAKDIMAAGNAEWLFGEPDWDERHRARELERARQLDAQAASIRSAVE